MLTLLTFNFHIQLKLVKCNNNFCIHYKLSQPQDIKNKTLKTKIFMSYCERIMRVSCLLQDKYEINGTLAKLMHKDPLAVQYVRDLMKRQPKE